MFFSQTFYKFLLDIFTLLSTVVILHQTRGYSWSTSEKG